MANTTDMARQPDVPAGDGDFSPALVVEAMWSAWAEQDIEALASWWTDDVVIDVHVPREVVPFGGRTEGRRAVTDVARTIRDQYEIVEYLPVAVYPGRGGIVRDQVRFRVRHRHTGEVLDGIIRHEIVVRDGLVAHIEEFHDAERMRAFLNLVAARSAETRIANLVK